MRRLLVQILFTSVVVLCSLDSPPLSEDMLRKLSAAGEEYVDEEIKQAILGVKQVKEMMGRKEEMHRQLIHALRQSSDKKMGVTQLAKETEQKLEEAEQKCRDLTKSSFRRCQPCLEDSCKAFYTSTCRRGYASFSFKVEEFFRKMAAQLEATEDVHDEQRGDPGATPSAENQVTEDEMDLEVLQAEGSFSQLLADTSLLSNHSIAVARRMEQVFGQSFLAGLTSDLQQNLLQVDPSGGFFKALGFDHILESAFDLGRDVLEDISSTVADVFGEIQEAEEYLQQSGRDAGLRSAYEQPPSRYLCRRLRRQVSECWQLRDLCEACKNDLIKDCPLVQQLHSELDDMHTLLNASRQQYNHRLQLLRRHTADTQRWLHSMQDDYGWLSQLSNTTLDPGNIFSVITVNPQQQMKNNQLTSDSSVVVSILGSTPLTVLVPADLVVDDPAFIQHVTQGALTRQKQQIIGKDPSADPNSTISQISNYEFK
ncbi:clusterin-like protein 1 [Cololabis saira]|uniref:clusterin-like protein 1 n=1 Tax=Cololabis saira TaxID=129043 RepID=UPI002AD23699|nr:clusterin-like protein 1 [Cololabis saira]